MELIEANAYNAKCLRTYINTFEKELVFNKAKKIVLDKKGNQVEKIICTYTKELLGCRSQFKAY